MMSSRDINLTFPLILAIYGGLQLPPWFPPQMASGVDFSYFLFHCNWLVKYQGKLENIFATDMNLNN